MQTVEDEDGEPPPLISPGDCKYILVPLYFLRQELVHVASYTVSYLLFVLLSPIASMNDECASPDLSVQVSESR